jgi:hypothetical protein
MRRTAGRHRRRRGEHDAGEAGTVGMHPANVAAEHVVNDGLACDAVGAQSVRIGRGKPAAAANSVSECSGWRSPQPIKAPPAAAGSATAPRRRGPVRQGNGCRRATFAAESTLAAGEDRPRRGPQRFSVEIGVGRQVPRLAGGASGLVPARVRLGRWMQLPRHARRANHGAPLHWWKHVAAASPRCRMRWFRWDYRRRPAVDPAGARRR